MVQPKTLTLLGKADDEVVRHLTQSVIEQSSRWFFVDYADEEVPVGSSFDVLLQGIDKTLIPNVAKITLKDVYEQFGNKLSVIPKGFQTICSFEFSQTPAEVDKLLTMQDWEYNPNIISLAKHESIQLSQPDAVLKVMHLVWVLEIKRALGKDKLGFPKPEVIQFIRKQYNIDDVVYIARVLNDWKMLGLAEEKPGGILELRA